MTSAQPERADMSHHEPTRATFVVNGNEWLIYPRDKNWFAHMVKYDSDTGPFSTWEQANDFIRLRGQ